MLMVQGAKVSAQRSLPTIEQTVGQIFDGQETSLLKGFHRDPLHPMPAQTRNALLSSHLKVLWPRIQSQGDGDLLAMRQRSGGSFLDRDHLEEHLPWLKRAAGLEVGSIDFVDGIQNGVGFERRTL